MRIKKDAQSIPIKVSMRLVLNIKSSKILLVFTDTVMGRRCTIGIQCFSTDLLWHESRLKKPLIQQPNFFEATESVLNKLKKDQLK